MGTEPLDARLTVLLTRSMMEKIEARAGGRIADFVRAVLTRELGGKRVRRRGKKKSRPGTRKSPVRRMAL